MIARLVHHLGRRCALVLVAGLAPACGDPNTGEPVEYLALALDVCGEMVPANRAVDGIPAYAQCDATMNSSIWSNNGVDTSLTSLGPDWVQTQRGGGYQCTELAYRYMRFRWNVSYRSGDAEEWCDGELPANLVKATTPVHGDLIVFAGGVCGAAESTGHIAVIDTVDAARESVTIVEENRASRRSTQQSCATCFLHATANDGAVGGAAGMGGTAGMGGAVGTGGTAMTGGSGNAMTGGSGGVAGTGGFGDGGMGAAGAGPATAGMAGASTGGSSTAGSPGLGGTGGSSPTTGGGPMNGDAGMSSGAAGANADAGTPGAAGASGAVGEPTEAESTLESGCSVSARKTPERRTPGLVVALCLLVGVLARRRTASHAAT